MIFKFQECTRTLFGIAPSLYKLKVCIVLVNWFGDARRWILQVAYVSARRRHFRSQALSNPLAAHSL